MFVISSRPKRVADGQWTILESDDGVPPQSSPSDPDELSATFLDSLQDPLLILIHGYHNTELQAFQQYVAASKNLSDNGFTGTVVGYDWPSVEGNASSELQLYKNDLKAVRSAGAPAFADFLVKLAATTADRNVRINLMAHSMGNFLLRTLFLENEQIAAELDNVVSFAPDMLQSDLEKDELKAAANALAGYWFVYWAQSDLILLFPSNWGNIALGNEKWRGQRLGQQGPKDKRRISRKVISQEWDAPIARDIGSQYSWDLREWPFNPGVHSKYWVDIPFLQNIAQNMLLPAGASPITVDWPLPPRL